MDLEQTPVAPEAKRRVINVTALSMSPYERTSLVALTWVMGPMMEINASVMCTPNPVMEPAGHCVGSERQ